MPPGRLRETSIVFLFSILWLPDQGLGTWLEESQALVPRVVEGMCCQTLPSGCPMAFSARGPQTGSLGKSCCDFGGDAGVPLLEGQHLH